MYLPFMETAYTYGCFQKWRARNSSKGVCLTPPIHTPTHSPIHTPSYPNTYLNTYLDTYLDTFPDTCPRDVPFVKSTAPRNVNPKHASKHTPIQTWIFDHGLDGNTHMYTNMFIDYAGHDPLVLPNKHQIWLCRFLDMNSYAEELIFFPDIISITFHYTQQVLHFLWKSLQQ